MPSTIDQIRALLRDDIGGGFARDYVIARLHGRRALMARAPAVAAGEATDEQIWDAFLGELNWLFRHMDPAMRAAHAPLFAMFEMKTIVLCLRNAALERLDARQRLLGRSLLSLPIQKILRQPRHVGAMVAELGGTLGGLSAPFVDLDSRYFEAGLKGCEDALMRLFLEALHQARLVPPVRGFFTRFTDLRNLMALYKHLRWDLKGPVLFIAGGSQDVKVLKNIVIREDRDALDAIVQSITGQQVTPANELALETTLLTSLSTWLARSRRQRGDDWLATDYIWSQYVHARNLAVRHHAGGMDRSTLERELIA